MGELPAILIIVENLPVPLDRRVWQESLALRDAGYRVVVVCPKMHGHVAAAEEIDRIQIYRYGTGLEAKGLLGYFLEYAFALWGGTRLAWKAWWRHRFKVIQLCNPPDLLFLIAWPFRLLGVKVIYDTHDLWPEMFEAKFGVKNPMYWAVRAAQRLTYACSDVVLVTNESSRQAALRNGHKPADRVFPVRTAPKIVQREVTAQPSLKKGRRHLVGYVGVMGSADGVHILLEAAADLVGRQQRRDIQFLLMGSGPEYGALVEMRDRLGLTDFVDMPGWANNDFLFPALQTIDLGVSCDPPNSYNHSCTMNKVLEYMAFGKPQVSFDLRETRATAGEAARYVPGSSARDLAEEIARTLDSAADRERMGREAAERMKNLWTWERSVEQLKLAYATVLGLGKT